MSENRFTVKRLDPLHCSRSEVLSMARSFRLTYSSDPAWQEYYTCPACSAAYPADNPPSVCTNEECPYPAPLVDFWTIPRILIDFYREMSRPDSVCFVAIDNDTGNVVGSCQGLFLTPDQLTEELGLNGHLELGPRLQERFGHRSKVAYQSEIQVVPSCQGKKLASQLFLARHRHFAGLDQEGITVFRTQRSPKKATSYKWMIDGMGYQIVAEYRETNHPDKRDRVIAAHSIQAGLDHYAKRD